jgi:hypothetical protein
MAKHEKHEEKHVGKKHEHKGGKKLNLVGGSKVLSAYKKVEKKK